MGSCPIPTLGIQRVTKLGKQPLLGHRWPQYSFHLLTRFTASRAVEYSVACLLAGPSGSGKPVLPPRPHPMTRAIHAGQITCTEVSTMKFNDLMFEWEPSPEDRPEVPCLASLSEAACRSPSFPPRASPARPRLLHPPPRPKFSRFGGQFVPRNSRPLSGLGSRVTHTLAGLRAALVMALVQASQQSKSASGQLARQLTAAWQQHAGAASRRVLSRGGRLWQQRRPRGLEPGIASPAVGPRARGPTSATPEVERLVQAGLAAERQYNVQLAVECFEVRGGGADAHVVGWVLFQCRCTLLDQDKVVESRTLFALSASLSDITISTPPTHTLTPSQLHHRCRRRCGWSPTPWRCTAWRPSSGQTCRWRWPRRTARRAAPPTPAPRS